MYCRDLFGIFASLPEAVRLTDKRVTTFVAPTTVSPVAAPHALYTDTCRHSHGKGRSTCYSTAYMRRLANSSAFLLPVWFWTAHRHLMTSYLTPMTNFCLTKLHILMIGNLSYACITETATDYCTCPQTTLSIVLFDPLLFTLHFCQKWCLSALSLKNKMNE